MARIKPLKGPKMKPAAKPVASPGSGARITCKAWRETKTSGPRAPRDSTRVRSASRLSQIRAKVSSMGLPPELSSALKAYFKEKRDVKKVILFGSRASSEESRRSDVDLLIVIDHPRPYLERLEEFRDLLLRFPRFEWDLLVWTEEELSVHGERPFMREILRKGRIIYERAEDP
ncbi:MAG TPA: nucleotidyltransferase domain-containing protein [Thermosulfurimonas dismutans]|uniref:Nucleotidyltransferase domain-containing protein n=1 Tax=Thermosulfurimonas dismutans TaxID=999894 RepID=A0A7C3GV95_9BACT|nr:nucleotidyltransferase domain-containing protein [Thermosulfurimonas dismutans]